MFVREGRVFTSASDLKSAVECEWALMRTLDAKLGRIDPVVEVEDAMLARAGALGNEHEERQLVDYRARFGAGVVEIPHPETELGPLREARDATLAALRSGAEVVFQGTFFDEEDGFVGFADFLVRNDRHEPAGAPAYDVYDTKLARKARVTALLQLAAYADQLTKLGIPVGDTVYLLLGNGETSAHRLADILPAYRDRVARLRWMIAQRLADPAPIAWGAEGYAACGRCAWCAVEVEAHRDVLLVAGMRTSQRDRLAARGIHTIDQLAALTDADAALVEGVGPVALKNLRAQAAMQVQKPESGVAFRVVNPGQLAALPEPDAGDIFFDFEGDPLWTDTGRDWGLEYLFGVIDHGDEPADASERFLPFWAHDRAQEKRALVEFLEYVQQRRRRFPNLHIYHYADYERSHLQLLCARHGTGEVILDELLREHVFVDLYPVVKRSIRISEDSYSLKKLEPLYMGDELRESTVTTGADSVQAYVDYSELVAAGRTADAERQLAEIADYNRYDCVSTLRLRDWLLARADEHGVPRRPPLPVEAPGDAVLESREDEVRARLYAPIDGIPAPERDADQTALALASAAIEYHRREDKSYWWEHYNRQIAPIEEWADARDVFVTDAWQLASDWHVPPGRKVTVRLIRLRGRLAPGSRLNPDDRPFVMYEGPHPPLCEAVPPGQKAEHKSSRVVEVTLDGERAEILLEESAGVDGETWTAGPVALTPAAPIPTKAQRAAILQWGARVAEGLPELAVDPSLDVLRRIPPRLADGGALTPPGDDVPAAIADSLRRLGPSTLAVQGPPGSGKTFVGGTVIATLLREHNWRIGVVAQSHEVVENLLRRVLSFGVPPSAVAKRPRSGGYAEPPPWTVLESNDAVTSFVSTEWQSGFVLGGTAWDFANAGKVPRGALDLLVIDEAGQFSLANTIAVGVSAQRVLLLGDPQQLPQVSQGAHPEPVDTSALGWLSDGHDVLPPELGYFLSESWRMHPALCAAVSDLAYEGKLRAHPIDRDLAGVKPGLHPVPVEHAGNSTESAEEADRVVELVRRHVGLAWTDAATGRRDPLRPSDVIVVAPYNAQVELIAAKLEAAGFDETPVGTVDKFQGQEAAVAIVSLTASSAADVPRGIGFVLMRNRLNVAISRAKWAAYLVHSPGLRDYLPVTPTGLAELSAFIRLTGG